MIRKRLVVDTAQPVRQFHGFADCVRKIAAREGIRGFYRCGGWQGFLCMQDCVLLPGYAAMHSQGWVLVWLVHCSDTAVLPIC